MANELTLTQGWTYDKNSRKRTRSSVADRITVAGDGVTDAVQSIGTAAHELLTVVDTATYGFAWFHNTDSTNFVEIGIDESGTFHPFLKLLAGEKCTAWLAEAPYAKADTASVELEYAICER